MENLLKDANIQDAKLKMFINRTIGTEISRLVEPCYYPQFHKYQYDLYKYTGLSERDMKAYTKQYWKNTKWSPFVLHNDHYTMLIIFIMQYFLNKKDMQTYQLGMIFYMLRLYSNLIHKQIKYCNKDNFKYVLDNINKTHLFYREKTIPNAIMFLGKEMQSRYTKMLLKNDVDSVGAFIQEARTRLSQSLKSFATLYYKARDEGLAYKNPYEDIDDDGNVKSSSDKSQKIDQLIDELAKRVTIYKYTDKHAINDAKSFSKIKRKYSYILSKQINNIKYTDDIKMFYRQLFKTIKKPSEICDKNFRNKIKELMSIKRHGNELNFKQHTITLTLKLVEDAGFFEDYNATSSKSKFTVIMFVALYISLLLQSMTCKK